MTDIALQKDLAVIAERHAFKVPALERRDGPVTAKSDKRLPPALLQLTQAALASYRASPDYTALLADFPDRGIADLHTRLQNALEGPHFAPLLAALRRPDSFDVSLDDFMPKAVSLGLLAEAVLILGLSGSVGYVMNIDLNDAKSGIYVGGAFDAGIDAGAQGDVCVGFWRESVDDLDGIYIGEEVDIDDVTGVTEAAFLNDDELALVFIGIDLGVEDGIENADFYFFEFDVGRAPIYQPGDATYLVQLGVLTCENSKDNYDTIYFEFLQDSDSTVYRYPAWDGYQMCESQENATYSTWRVGLIAKFNSSLTLRLHVGDHTMKDVKITAGNFSGLNGSYTIPWDETVDAFDEIKYSMDVSLIRN